MRVRARIASPDMHPEGPLPHNLLAVAIAFGARFSEHPAIDKDREECTARDKRHDLRTRSRMVQLLVIRAREVAETWKTHRIRSLDNVRVLVLLETMSARERLIKLSKYALSDSIAEIPYLKDSEPIARAQRTRLIAHVKQSISRTISTLQSNICPLLDTTSPATFWLLKTKTRRQRPCTLGVWCPSPIASGLYFIASLPACTLVSPSSLNRSMT